jgi:hypothetical protein
MLFYSPSLPLCDLSDYSHRCKYLDASVKPIEVEAKFEGETIFPIFHSNCNFPEKREFIK